MNPLANILVVVVDVPIVPLGMSECAAICIICGHICVFVQDFGVRGTFVAEF